MEVRRFMSNAKGRLLEVKLINIVRVGGGWILIDKYMEINAPIEEARIVKANNVSDKYKTHAFKQVLGNDKNIYEIGGKKLGLSMQNKKKK